MNSLNTGLVLDAIAYIPEWTAYRQKTSDIPGLSVAVRFDDDLLLEKAYGFADVERRTPMSPRHTFRIASHSKTFTATAIMLLVEEGALRLDDRVGDRLTGLPSAKGEIGRTTVRQLLSHAGGIAREGPDGNFWQYESGFPTTGELLTALASSEPAFSSNDQFKYSNLAYSLLGLVVESAAGMPYNDFVTQRIVDALGLTETGPETTEHMSGSLATGYSSRRFGMKRFPLANMNTGAMSPAAGFYSTAAELCRYGAAHFLGNEELLSDESKREMQHGSWEVEGADEHYGLGFEVFDYDGTPVVAHSGGFPGFITSTRIDPRARLVVVALTNAIDGPAEEITAGMLRLIYKAAATEQASPEKRAGLDRYTGRYFSIWGTIDIVRFGGSLFAIDPDADNPVEQPAELEVIGDGTLRITKDSGFESVGENALFSWNEAGEVTHMSWGSYNQYSWAEFQKRWPLA